MKLKNVATLCKQKKSILVHDKSTESGTQQFIGVAAAAYPVTGLPYMTAEEFTTLWDISEKKKEEFSIWQGPAEGSLSFCDNEENDCPVSPIPVDFTYKGHVLRPVKTTDGVLFIDTDCLAPLSDVLDLMELYQRRSSAGSLCVVAKVGFWLQAIIMPYDLAKEEFLHHLRQITEDGMGATTRKNARNTAGESTSLQVDFDTGELVEVEP